MISVAATRKVARLTSSGDQPTLPEASRFPELFTLVVRSPQRHPELHGVATRSGDAFPGDGCGHCGLASTVAMRSAASQTSTKLV